MKALIIEDENPAAKQLINILKKLNDIEVVDILDSIKSTIQWFKINAQPDVVFMDIHIADGSAFKIFDFIEITCPIIFTTAYDEYAINAFKVNSVDYLLKPITQEAVEKAFKKINVLTGEKSTQQEISQIIKELNRTKSYKTHFLASVKGSKMVPLLAEEIAFFYINEGKVKAVNVDKKEYQLDFTLDELNTKLNPVDFFRANRQFIVSRKGIKELDSWFNGRLSVVLKIPAPEKILISRTRVGEFKAWFTGQ
ncbi:LytTR family DNA-binding domain-containing protein [uncultured Draconibacterium sp.]|uniref:LytR/AlgR family response regulator transcription factor n=1 Tax=uncultured Draconibacterium sp. TaxID=1573823 RepID=UPI002AA9334B|nr:LytTR family DNA-binding domain-containing protein [uncultured Draconibacterium sp.]